MNKLNSHNLVIHIFFDLHPEVFDSMIFEMAVDHNLLILLLLSTFILCDYRKSVLKYIGNWLRNLLVYGMKVELLKKRFLLLTINSYG